MTTTAGPGVMARAAARAAVREGRDALRRLRDGRAATPALEGTLDDGEQVRVEPLARRATTGPFRRQSTAPHDVAVARIVRGGTGPAAGSSVGEIWTRHDPGTATYEVLASTDPALDGGHRALAGALGLVLADVGNRSPDLRIAVRVPLDPAQRPWGPDGQLLRGLGLTLVATFPGTPDGPRRWGGEERWELLPAQV